jgi:hypothetical protein
MLWFKSLRKPEKQTQSKKVLRNAMRLQKMRVRSASVQATIELGWAQKIIRSAR